MAYYLEIEYEGSIKKNKSEDQLVATIEAAIAPHVADVTKTKINLSHGRLHVRLLIDTKQLNAINNFAKNMVAPDFIIRATPTYKFWEAP